MVRVPIKDFKYALLIAHALFFNSHVLRFRARQNCRERGEEGGREEETVVEERERREEVRKSVRQ